MTKPIATNIPAQQTSEAKTDGPQPNGARPDAALPDAALDKVSGGTTALAQLQHDTQKAVIQNMKV
jgi:hypothetical protein